MDTNKVTKLSQICAKLDEESQKRAVKFPWLIDVPEADAEAIVEIMGQLEKGKYAELPSKRIAEIIIEEFNLDVSVSTLRRYVANTRGAGLGDDKH